MTRVVVAIEPERASRRVAGETLAARWMRLGEQAGVAVAIVAPGDAPPDAVDGRWLAWTADDLADHAAGGPGGRAQDLTSPRHLAALERTEVEGRRQALLDAGVYLEGGGPVLIGPRVVVAPGATLGPSVVLTGTTTIAEGATIDHGVHLHDTVVGPRAHLKPHTVATGARIGARAAIGPFAQLRPGTVLGDDVHIGNFVETKQTTLADGAKANHLAYLGDAEIGPGSNIGAGTITCNYDGGRKHRTVVGAGVFVGTNSSLVAPVHLGDGSLIAAGSVITEDVPRGALALGRARQHTLDGRGADILQANRAARAAQDAADQDGER